MDHTHHFKNLLVKLVMQVADNFPVKYISNISFLYNETLVVACFWNQVLDDGAAPQCGESMLPSVVFYDAYDYLLPTKVEISGIDSDDKPFNLYLPLEFVARRYAA